MEQILEQLECVDVNFENNNKKACLIFLDPDQGEIREVSFNKQIYDKASNEFVDNEEKAAKVEQLCEEHFQLSFDELGQAIGMRKDVYCYDTFNSVYPVKLISKFEEDELGLIFETEVIEVVDDGQKISIQFEYDNKLHESKMQYADYLEARQEWFVNPNKKKKQYDKFEEKFQIPISNMEELKGKTIMVEVKKAYGKFMYAEIKPFKKVKK